LLQKLYLSTLILTTMFTLTYAQTPQKSAIQANGILLYQAKKTASNLSQILSEGNFYGRLRNNNFYFSYDHEDSGHEDNLVAGTGISLIYRSARFSGFDFDIGAYAAHSFFNENKLNDYSHLKAAKDTLSRAKFVNGGSHNLFVLGQANLNYTYKQIHFTLGRQLVDTFYTKSNDTKMVPNTFDGFVLKMQDIPKSNILFAYLTKQKLRDHEKSHSVFMVGDANSSTATHPEWTQNDDSAMHKGLTYSALVAAGKPTDAPLIVFDITNTSIQNLKINFAAYSVPQLLSQTMGELNYKLNFKNFSITPGFRYIQQFDNGAGAVGGASLKADTTAYNNPNSLDAQMIAARVVTRFEDYKLNLAYTNILDKADLVTPWRGFPTAGYTRSMGMYNWQANTKSYRLELVKGANASGIYKTPFIQTSILYIDGDERKSVADSMFYYAGIVQNLPSLPAFQYRLRLGYREFIHDTFFISNYVDSRLEFNYLF